MDHSVVKELAGQLHSECEGWNWMTFEVPFNPNHSMILFYDLILCRVFSFKYLKGISKRADFSHAMI